jgi:hypothetical protein
MALSVLTDSERKVYDSMKETTRAKFEAALRKSGLPEMTAKILAEVEVLRKQNAEIHETTKKSGSILKTWANMIRQGAKDLRD